MAASIELKDGELIVHIHGWDKVRAMRGSLTVPFAHVTGARAHPKEAWFDDVIVNSSSGVGVYVPGQLAVGTLDLADGRAFFDVHDPEKAIAIDLHDETPEEAVRRIERAFDGGPTPATNAGQ